MMPDHKKCDRGNPVQNGENNRQNLLTCIHQTYTLASPQEKAISEAEKLMINNFLETLADVAISVASRQVNK